jgi:hypothetical protein
MFVVEILKMRGASDRALKAAFVRVRDALKFEASADVVEPRWNPEGGCAFLRKKEYEIVLSYDHSDATLRVQCSGRIPEKEETAIAAVLRDPPLPLKAK